MRQTMLARVDENHVNTDYLLVVLAVKKTKLSLSSEVGQKFEA